MMLLRYNRSISFFDLLLSDVVKIGNHLGMGSEHVRTPAHHSPPKLPLIAMIAPFVSFTVAYSWSCSPLLKPIRFPTRLFVVIQTLTPSPQAYTVSYDVIRYHALLFISAHFSSCSCLFRALKQTTQLLPQAYVQSSSSTSCIRLQRLYSPAFRPSLLDRAETIRFSSIALPLLMIALGPKVYLKTLTCWH